MTNLLSALANWTEAIESDFDTDVIYTDFAKAFVPHHRLLKKLESIGIVGEFLKWIMSFLTGRKHKVCVGLMQGVLGPISFVIFINDMPNTITYALCR